MLKRILRNEQGEGYIDTCVLVLCAVLVIALAVRVLPVFIAKQQLDTFATELVRKPAGGPLFYRSGWALIRSLHGPQEAGYSSMRKSRSS